MTDGKSVSAVDRYENVEEAECEFDDCDWSTEYIDDESGRMVSEADREMHYLNEHAGKARVQVVLEKEVVIGDREPHDLTDQALDDLEDHVRGYEVAYSRAEVLEEADDHSEVKNDG